MNKDYLTTLKELKKFANDLPKTRTMAIAKINTLIKMNMCWEKYQLDKNLKEHPFKLTNDLVLTAIDDLKAWQSISFCDAGLAVKRQDNAMESQHHDLFQALWVSFNKEQYAERIELYNHRLGVNNLNNDFFYGKKIIDMGCGHGNFAHSMLGYGASYVLGIDYGEESIDYANKTLDEFNIPKDRIQFRVESVYEVQEPDNSFDFAVQNGVFHHLDDEDKAYKEMHRLLKPDGYAWIYTEGEGSVARDLFHVSVQILSDIPPDVVQENLRHLGFTINKRYHLGDGLSAVYRATSFKKLSERLEKIGFYDFKRQLGGMDTDLDILGDDPWAQEKFGEGDIRILMRKR